jgi:hypothetical protein
VWIYTQSNITQASYSPEYVTLTQQINYQDKTVYDIPTVSVHV